jgi:hypothetical protein
MPIPCDISQRRPSSQWEPLSIDRVPGLVLWAWFRPVTIPSGIMISIPPELMQNSPTGFPITLADILSAAGVFPHQFQAVALFGGIWQPAAVVAAFVNHPLPPVPPGGRAEILISFFEPVLMPVAMPIVPMLQESNRIASEPATPHVIASAEDDLDECLNSASVDWSDELAEDLEFEDAGELLTDDTMFNRIEALWKSATQLERQMTGLRQKLSAMQSALGKMDRELAPDERLASDREDRDEWNDTRRWLRDLQSKCHREVKAFDIGMTSSAGGRHYLENIFSTIVEPRVKSSKLPQYRTEFEKHRKDMVSLQRGMVAALTTSAQNGTQRAQRVLGKIARKIRELRARNREAIGGTNMDRSVRRKR